jgi:hypothetical protein
VGQRNGASTSKIVTVGFFQNKGGNLEASVSLTDATPQVSELNAALKYLTDRVHVLSSHFSDFSRSINTVHLKPCTVKGAARA